MVLNGDSLAVVGDVQALGAAVWATLSSGDPVAVTIDEPGVPLTDLASDVPTVAGPAGPTAAAAGSAGPPAADSRPGGSVNHDPRPRATHWLVVTRSAVLTEVLAAHGERIAGNALLLAPGGFGGALRARQWFGDNGLAVPRIAETTGFPAMGVRDDGAYRVRAVKRNLPFAALSGDVGAAEALLAEFRRWIPDLVPSDLVTTSLGNTNHLIHPPLVVTNGTRIARGEPFTFYREGLADQVGGLLEAVDAERRAVVAALGGDARSGRDWLVGFYGDQGMTGGSLVAALRSFGPFATTPSPPRLDYRYLTDDIPYGVAAWAALARRLGTPSHHLAALQLFASSLLGRALDPPDRLVDAVVRHVLGEPAPSDPASPDPAPLSAAPTDQPTTDRPTTDRPTTNQPTTNQPTTNQPTTTLEPTIRKDSDVVDSK